MKITIELPDDLLQKAQALATSHGQILEQFIIQLMRREIDDPDGTETDTRRDNQQDG